MPQIGPIEPAENNAVLVEQTGGLHFLRLGPARRSVGRDILGFACPPDRHADGNRYGDETTGRGDHTAFHEDRRRIGVVEIPPPEKGRWVIDRPTGNHEPGMAELGLEAELPGRPLCRSPGRH